MKLSKIISKLRQIAPTLANINQKFDEIKMNQGYILAAMAENKNKKTIQDSEYKIFSQWGEDGIIQHLVNSIEIKNKTFIEFGVEDFIESNCRYLMMKDNWRGFVIDGSVKNIDRVKGQYFYWKYDLEAVASFIDVENINDLLARSGFDYDLGILSIDIDGNDYYVLEAIKFFRPRILICEYNSLFGPSRTITVPYDPNFRRTNAHYSNLFFGASLGALYYLAQKKGYSLVATSSAGVNAFFVRNDLMKGNLQSLAPEEAYTSSHFRESRNKAGELTFVSGDKRFEIIRGQKVFNVATNTEETL